MIEINSSSVISLTIFSSRKTGLSKIMRIKPQTNIEKFELALESLEKYKTILYSGKGIFGRRMN